MLISDSGEDTKFEFDPDSAGMYFNESGASPNAAAYRYKMEFLWQYKDFANVVILGSSRASRGVNPLLFSEPIFAINLAIGATSILGHTAFFNNYVLPHVKNLKVLVISIDIDRGKNIGSNTNNIFYDAYKSYPGYVYDMNHDYWKGKNTAELFEMTYNSPGSNTTTSP